MALQDGRSLTKAICCVPRHPDDCVRGSSFPAQQRALLRSLRSWKASIAGKLDKLDKSDDGECGLAPSGDGSSNDGPWSFHEELDRLLGQERGAFVLESLLGTAGGEDGDESSRVNEHL